MKLPSTDAQASDTSGSDNSQTLGPDKIFARLRLTADDLEALKQQGTVQAEWRGRNGCGTRCDFDEAASRSFVTSATLRPLGSCVKPWPAFSGTIATACS